MIVKWLTISSGGNGGVLRLTIGNPKYPGGLGRSKSPPLKSDG